MILELIARNPEVRSAARVMRAGIRDGNGPVWLAQVRRAAPADQRPDWCGRADKCDPVKRVLLDENGYPSNQPCPECGHRARPESGEEPSPEEAAPAEAGTAPGDPSGGTPGDSGPQTAVVGLTGENRCQDPGCKAQDEPVGPGRTVHVRCEWLAPIRASRRRQMVAVGQMQAPADRSPYPDGHRSEPDDGKLPAMFADAPPDATEFLAKFGASAPYPDDFRDELPEDFGDGDHIA